MTLREDLSSSEYAVKHTVNLTETVYYRAMVCIRISFSACLISFLATFFFAGYDKKGKGRGLGVPVSIRELSVNPNILFLQVQILSSITRQIALFVGIGLLLVLRLLPSCYEVSLSHRIAN